MKKLFFKSSMDGKKYIIFDGMLIGRTPPSDVVLLDDKVSSSHLKVSLSDGNLFITDLNTTNGTLLNGTRIVSSKPVEVFKNDKVQLGQFILYLLDSEKDISSIGGGLYGHNFREFDAYEGEVDLSFDGGIDLRVSSEKSSIEEGRKERLSSYLLEIDAHKDELSRIQKAVSQKNKLSERLRNLNKENQYLTENGPELMIYFEKNKCEWEECSTNIEKLEIELARVRLLKSELCQGMAKFDEFCRFSSERDGILKLLKEISRSISQEEREKQISCINNLEMKVERITLELEASERDANLAKEKKKKEILDEIKCLQDKLKDVNGKK